MTRRALSRVAQRPTPADWPDEAVADLLAKARRIADDGELIPRWSWQTIQSVLRDLVRVVEDGRS